MSRPSRPRRSPSRPPGRDRNRRPPRDLARRTAYDALRAVETRDAYANLLLPALIRDRGLTGRDAALATELTYGTLRALGTYDAVLAACSDRPLERVDAELRDVLRLGAHQLLRTRIPAHAAVAATVDLARAVVGEASARFANAVLRKVATRDLDAWVRVVAPPLDTDPIGHLALAHSHPRWIVSALRDALGGDLAETAAALAADNEPATVTLLAKPGQASQDELVKAGAQPARWSPYAAYLSEGDPVEVPAVAEGRAAVQDEASQLVAAALAAAPIQGPDRRWLDMCAGPGGKAALLAGLAAQRGARLLAADVRYRRAMLVRAALTGGDPKTFGVVVSDGTVPAWRPAAFDRVLLDAPCTGLGSLRRRPEARWRRTPGSVAELAALQRRLLGSALDAARPGGVVAYVTCSPHIAETQVVVTDLLRGRDDVTVLDAPALLAPVPGLGDGPYAQFWPHRHGTDAMFCALLARR